MATLVKALTRVPFQNAATVRSGVKGAVGFLQGNLIFSVGLSLILFLILFTFVGRLFVDVSQIYVGTAPSYVKPSVAYPLGTDALGRNLLALMVVGIPNTLKIGLLAGGIGTLIGIVLGLLSGYFRGPIDTVIRSFADVFFVIPTLVILITLAAYVRVVSVEMMALIVGLLAWPWPTRVIRSQTLSLRERPFVRMAILSAKSDLEIIFFEILPNLLPYVAASFVGAVGGGILAAVGLEILGLGPQRVPTVGAVLFWALFHSAIFQGLWWWYGPPVLTLVVLFSGLFLMSVGLDVVANPKLKGAAKAPPKRPDVHS